MKYSNSKCVAESKKTTTGKSLKESVNDELIWSSSAKADWVYDTPIEELRMEIIDEGNLDEDEVYEMDEDDIRDYFLDNEQFYGEQDHEDLMYDIIPQIESQCSNGLWLVGNYQRWDGGHNALAYYKDAGEGLEDVCYPDYDSHAYLYKDSQGIYFTETSHDTPVGGTAMYLYTLADIGAALELADEIYPEDNWEHELYEVAEDFKWVKACIEKGYMKHIKSL